MKLLNDCFVSTAVLYCRYYAKPESPNQSAQKQAHLRSSGKCFDGLGQGWKFTRKSAAKIKPTSAATADVAV